MIHQRAIFSLIILSAMVPPGLATAPDPVPNEPSGTPAPTPTPFSIEGIRIGMTPAEAEAAAVDIREAKHVVRDDQRGLLYRIRTDDKTTAEAIPRCRWEDSYHHGQLHHHQYSGRPLARASGTILSSNPSV